MRRLHVAALAAVLVVSVIPSAEARSGKEQWRESGVVAAVLDGDTFDMTTETGLVRVRVTGIQAPESSWCGGKEAKDALREILPEGTEVRLASRKETSGNAPGGVWRVKRTVHVEVDGEWVDIAPGLLSRGVVFPFPFIGESTNNEKYLDLALAASEKQVGVFDPTACGSSGSAADEEHLSLEVVPDGPGRDSADSEFVMIYNGSDHDIDLRGWMVQDTSPLNAYFFPKGAVVRADDYVVVFSGSGTRGVAPDGSEDDRFFFAGTGARWNNDTTDIAFLFDDAGKDRTGNLRDWLILTPES
jgi:endonuclease YncB( thermonuclease family)